MNLRSCVWTRYGSLNPPIIRALQTCPIVELEINADPGQNYAPSQLLGFSALESLKLVLPARPVRDILGDWTHATRSTLRSLSIICATRKVSIFRLFLPEKV